MMQEEKTLIIKYIILALLCQFKLYSSLLQKIINKRVNLIMGKKNNGKKRENKAIEWVDLITQAVTVSGESKVIETVSKKCRGFNDIAGLQEYIAETLPQSDTSTRGWLNNSLRKLGKTPRVNKYADQSKAHRTVPTSEYIHPKDDGITHDEFEELAQDFDDLGIEIQ